MGRLRGRRGRHGGRGHERRLHAARERRLGLLALGLWWTFGWSFAQTFTTACGEACTAASVEVSPSLGVYLGLAVLSSAFSAALLAVHLIKRGR